jgi:hypothetical protein
MVHYVTKEFKIPSKNTRKTQALAPEKTKLLACTWYPVGAANTTGTPTTRTNDNTINANKAI